MSWQHWTMLVLELTATLINFAVRTNKGDGTGAATSLAAGVVVIGLLVWGQPG